SQWERIGQDEAFVGRCGEVGDELGSRVIAARLVQQIMRLCFLMERKYAPYAKWFGSAFSRLDCALALAAIFDGVLSTGSWREREGHLSEAYRVVAEMHNGLGITRPMETRVSNYHTRPYMVIHSEVFAAEIRKAIEDDAIRGLSTGIGSVNQFAGSSDVLEDVSVCEKLRVLYD
ncbi:MAG: DUF4037 domain-containing protein, partial [Chloroflexia bacterium]